MNTVFQHVITVIDPELWFKIVYWNQESELDFISDEEVITLAVRDNNRNSLLQVFECIHETSTCCPVNLQMIVCVLLKIKL